MDSQDVALMLETINRGIQVNKREEKDRNHNNSGNNNKSICLFKPFYKFVYFKIRQYIPSVQKLKNKKGYTVKSASHLVLHLTNSHHDCPSPITVIRALGVLMHMQQIQIMFLLFFT